MDVAPDATIDRFRKEVKTENPNKVANVDVSDLRVFKSMADLNERRHIDEEVLVTNIVGQQKMAKEDALLVMVPQGT